MRKIGAALLALMWAAPAWAADVPVFALQHYWDFQATMKANKWTEMPEGPQCNQSGACIARWRAPDGSVISIKLIYKNDAFEFYMAPALAN